MALGPVPVAVLTCYGALARRPSSTKSCSSAAYCDLLRLGLHHGRLPDRDECLPVTEVVAAPQADAWRSPMVLEFVINAYDAAPNREYKGQFLFRLDGTAQRR